MTDEIFDFDEVKRIIVRHHACDANYYELIKLINRKGLTDEQKRNIVYAFNEKRESLFPTAPQP